ncbi:hypothetical protein [Massilia sp. TWP1-3-3]|uniref:hypothetical protein n=1 Tax=Massilia sp. TWP1-3-3 TaxID=2804573 RepID=UPI003CEE5516
MWALSRLNSKAATAAAGLMLIFSTAGAAEPDFHRDPLLRYRGNAQVHSLYDIREAARTFLTRESVGRKVAYEPMDPDIRIVVPRCLVPLKARWARKSVEYDQPGVEVVCKRSVNKKYDHSWDVFVPLFQPEVAEKWRLLEEKNKRDGAAVPVVK